MKMLKKQKTATKMLWVASAISAFTLTLFDVFLFWGKAEFQELVFFAVIVTIFPPAALAYANYRRRRAVDEQLPELFKSLVQAQQTGITLPQALEEAAKRDYGPLTTELKKTTQQISWGMSFEEALSAFGRRVNTALVQRTVPIIIEANLSGGQTEKVFDPMGKFIQTTLLLEKERRTQTRPYIAIIYITFFVFLFTIVMLFKSFFVSVGQLPTLGTPFVEPEGIKRIFFDMTMIQAFFGGLVAGKMGEGTIIAGLKHSLVLMLCGYLALKLFL